MKWAMSSIQCAVVHTQLAIVRHSLKQDGVLELWGSTGPAGWRRAPTALQEGLHRLGRQHMSGTTQVTSVRYGYLRSGTVKQFFFTWEFCNPIAVGEVVAMATGPRLSALCILRPTSHSESP